MNVVQLAQTGELATALARPVGILPSELGIGFHPAYSEELYHYREFGVASSTVLGRVLRSPAHYKTWLDGKDDDDDDPGAATFSVGALSLGKALHCAALEPSRFRDQYVIAPDFGDCRYKGPKANRDAWLAEHKGCTILDSRSGGQTLGMVNALLDHPIVSGLLDGATCKLTLRWDDPRTGIPCKARTDIYQPRWHAACDLKSCTDARKPAFLRSVENYGYFRQEAHYRMGFEILESIGLVDRLEHFTFIAVEKHPPYGIQLHELEPESIEEGRLQVRDAIDQLAECVASGRFPGYPHKIQRINMRPWAFTHSRV